MTCFHVLAGCSLLALSTAAQAQPVTPSGTAETPATQSEVTPTNDPTAAPETANTGTETDIVVTAQRRSQNLQDVPIAITVVNGDALNATAANNIRDIQNFAPSLTVTEGGGQTSFRVRGVGSQSFDTSIETSVGFVIDDVVQTLPRTSTNNLADIDRVEVLRGPQGTLFGRNTTAGLISITTRRPALGVTSYEGRVQVGSRDELQTYQIVNLPLGDTAALRLRGAVQKRSPIVRNLGPGRISDTSDSNLNAKLLFEPNDRLTLYAIGDYQRSKGDLSLSSVRRLGAGTLAPAAGTRFIANGLASRGIVPGTDNRLVNLSGDVFQRSESYSGQLTGSYDFGPATLTSVTAYRDVDITNLIDADSSSLPVLDQNRGTIKGRQFTQEVRLSNSNPARVEYVAGLFYYDRKLDTTQIQQGTLGFVPPTAPFLLSTLGGRQDARVNSKSYAGFADLTFKATDQLRLILGGRYTRDELDSVSRIVAVPGVCSTNVAFGGPCNVSPLPVSGERNGSEWSGRAGVQFDLNRDVMLYATASRGFKAAAVTVVSGNVFSIDPETVFALEAGVKGSFLNRRLGVSLAAFRSKFKDFQTEVFDPSIGAGGAFRTGNAGSLLAQGFEAELTAKPYRGLNLSAGLTYNDATFSNYFPPCYPGQTAALGCNRPGPTFDASGLRLPNAPKWVHTVTGAYETPISSSLKIFATANWSHRSSVFFGVGDPGTFQKGYGVLNLSAGIGDINDRARVSVFARNALDKRFVSRISPTFFDTGGYSQAWSDLSLRRVGAAIDWSF